MSKRKNKFAATMRAWRKQHELSQTQAAEALGVPFRTLQGWEVNRPPTHPSLVLLAMAYLGLGGGVGFGFAKQAFGGKVKDTPKRLKWPHLDYRV